MRIFEHNLYADKEKTRRNTVVLQVLLTRSSAYKFAEQTQGKLTKHGAKKQIRQCVLIFEKVY